eukprot:243742_1
MGLCESKQNKQYREEYEHHKCVHRYQKSHHKHPINSNTQYTHHKHHTYKQDLQAPSPRPHVIYVPMQRAAQPVHHMDQIKEGAPPPFNPALLETNQLSNHNGEGQKQQIYQQQQAPVIAQPIKRQATPIIIQQQPAQTQPEVIVFNEQPRAQNRRYDANAGTSMAVGATMAVGALAGASIVDSMVTGAIVDSMIYDSLW